MSFLDSAPISTSPIDSPAVPVRLTHEVHELLTEESERALMEPASESEILTARVQAREAAEAANGRSDIQVLADLCRANARAVRAESRHVLGFPERVATSALFALMNLYVAVGRVMQTRKDLDNADKHYREAVALLPRIRALTRGKPFDRTVAAVVSRACTVIGELGAERGETLRGALALMDSEVIGPTRRSFPECDLSGPRAFGAVSFLRHLLIHEKDERRIRSIWSELVRVRDGLVPTDAPSRSRYASDLASLSTEFQLRTGGEP